MTETKRKPGRQKERPEGEHAFTARLAVRTYRLLRLVAEARGESVNAVLNQAADEWLARQPGAEALAQAVDTILAGPKKPKKKASK